MKGRIKHRFSEAESREAASSEDAATAGAQEKAAENAGGLRPDASVGLRPDRSGQGSYTWTADPAYEAWAAAARPPVQEMKDALKRAGYTGPEPLTKQELIAAYDAFCVPKKVWADDD